MLVYPEKAHQAFEREPPPITHPDFISQAQAWVDAMGGKFRGDAECGCVPHHYSLSVDLKSVQDSNRAGNSVVHIELVGHTDIPLKFTDDGSFEAEEPLEVAQTGYTRAVNIECATNGNIAMKFKVQGTVEDSQPALHLVFSNSSTGGSVATTCNNGITGSHAYPNVPNPPGKHWDMPSIVGVDQNVPMPYQSSDFTSSLKFRINQTDRVALALCIFDRGVGRP